MQFSQVFCVAMAAAIVMTSPASTIEPASSEGTGAPADDQVCYVPSTERPRNQDKLVFFEVLAPVPMYNMNQYLVFPLGTCGVEIFFLFETLYVDPVYQNNAKAALDNIPQYCTATLTNGGGQSNDTILSHFGTQILRTANDKMGINASFVPASELARVPQWWTPGTICRSRIQRLVRGRHSILCSIPFFWPVPNSQYNLNVTLEINGCPSGRYGGECEELCTCAEGVECHSFSGACLCPAGLQGALCDQREPLLNVNEQQIYVTYGDSTDLTCTTDGMVPAAYEWVRDGQTTTLVTSAEERDVPYTPKPVAVTTVLRATDTSINGGYTCIVRDENGMEYRRHVNVTVIAIPDPFAEVPRNRTVLVGSDVTLTCALRPDAGAVRWVRGHGPPDQQAAGSTDGSGRYEIRRISASVSQLRIRGVQFADEDTYRCYAGHIFKKPDLYYAEAILTVQSDPEPACSFGDATLGVSAGESLTLRCVLARAKPVPGFAWSLGGESSGTDRLQPRTTSVLTADGLSRNLTTSVTLVPSPEDDGKTVTVTITSPARNGTRRVMTPLNVTYSPIVTITPDPVTLTLGQMATVRCTARGNPTPSAYVWTLGRPVKSSSHANRSEFVIAKATADYDRSNLTCRVANAVGERQMTVQIEVAGPPSSTGAIAGFSTAGGLCVLLLVLATLLIHRHRREINLWWAKRAGKYKATDDKRYDVFISYKSGGKDEDFVVRSMIPRLEADGYRICVHYRAFVPGRNIIDNIADAVHWSRKTVLLLSPEFLESEWCRYEFQAALSQMLHLRTDLVPVVLSPLGPAGSLCQDLQTMLRTLSYIAWPGTGTGDGDEDDEGDTLLERAAEVERFWRLLRQSMPDEPLGLDGDQQHLDAESLGADRVSTGPSPDGSGSTGGASCRAPSIELRLSDIASDDRRQSHGDPDWSQQQHPEVAVGEAHDHIQLIGV